MTRLTLPATLTTLALVLAACGGGGYGSSSSSSSKKAAPGGAVSSKQVGGIGSVLVDSSGMALYTPDQEAGGKVACTGSCTSIWMPLQASGGTPKGAGQLGVVKRPDGSQQVTVGGKPVYTFAQDAPGKVTGDGAKDAFGGKRFTWHVVKAGGGSGSAAPSGGGTTSSSRGAYGY